ncbi:hypothetical protein [Chitinophaga rhizosphaerae]|uniref:hypothetical protein n=1 Tax=Chitinophaga rhizosphaerae TaxID=1864947 RepID=UPI000F808AC7|nr:hypothetical protein [Chitinophaga rhizosphaerae]
MLEKIALGGRAAAIHGFRAERTRFQEKSVIATIDRFIGSQRENYAYENMPEKVADAPDSVRFQPYRNDAFVIARNYDLLTPAFFRVFDPHALAQIVFGFMTMSAHDGDPAGNRISPQGPGMEHAFTRNG